MSAQSQERVPEWVPKSRLVSGEVARTVRPDFRREFIDFERGIRMGNLEPHQRITQIVKAALEDRHPTRFTIDRWGRGVYWKWICWVPLESRKAKPLSSGYNFGSAKYYISLNRDRQTFEAGMQVERAPLEPGTSHAHTREDWDFHAVVRGLRRGRPLAKETSRLVREEGFTVRAGSFAGREMFSPDTWRGPAPLRRACERIPPDAWGGLQLAYEFSRGEIKAATGDDIVGSVLAIFDELVPAMNAVLTVPCLRPRSPGGPAGTKPGDEEPAE